MMASVDSVLGVLLSISAVPLYRTLSGRCDRFELSER